MKLTLNYHQDAAHGWLEVPHGYVQSLAIPVSGYSYMRGNDLYLEEDCDMSRFMAAAMAAGWLVNLVRVEDGDWSPIRNYQRPSNARPSHY